ncbi:hypothetical protein Tco_0526423 [Tanacetum coccineum]
MILMTLCLMFPPWRGVIDPTQASSSFAQDLQYQLYLKIKDDKQVFNSNLSIWCSLKIKFKLLATPAAAPCQVIVVRTSDHEDHHDDDARPEGERSLKRQKTSEHDTYLVGESSSEQLIDKEPNPSNSGTQEQLDEFDAWIDDFGTYDDEVPIEEVSPKFLEEISGKEDLSLQLPQKLAPVYHTCQRDLKDPPMTFQNKDLFYLKHGNSRPKKYILSFQKYHAVPFLENDIEELTIRWVSKCIKRFNLYARYSVEH